MKRTPLKRTTPLRTHKPLLRRTQVSKVSARRQVELRAYSQLRKQFLAEHPCCERCGKPASDVHHMAGRRGPWLLRVELWRALCRTDHIWVTEHPALAVAEGWSVLRIEAA